jgi:hypothetical protein
MGGLSTVRVGSLYYAFDPAENPCHGEIRTEREDRGRKQCSSSPRVAKTAPRGEIRDCEMLHCRQYDERHQEETDNDLKGFCINRS